VVISDVVVFGEDIQAERVRVAVHLLAEAARRAGRSPAMLVIITVTRG
jgi:hypothetical protein